MIKRSEGRARANVSAASWKASVARYDERKRQQNRWRWVRFLDRMVANHAAVSEDFGRRAEGLLASEADRGRASGRQTMRDLRAPRAGAGEAGPRARGRLVAE